jgi:hypothetical protein
MWIEQLEAPLFKNSFLRKSRVGKPLDCWFDPVRDGLKIQLKLTQ